MLFEQDLAPVEKDGCVDGRFTGIGRRRQSNARDKSGGQVTRGSGKFFDGFAAALKKTRLLEEVGGRVSADGQFRKDGKTGALIGGTPAYSQYFFKVAGEIPDRGVDLGQCDVHISSLMQENEGISWLGGTGLRGCGALQGRLACSRIPHD